MIVVKEFVIRGARLLSLGYAVTARGDGPRRSRLHHSATVDFHGSRNRSVSKPVHESSPGWCIEAGGEPCREVHKPGWSLWSIR